jgi:hypothetical protein
LKEQADKLGIMNYIQEAISKTENPDKYIENVPEEVIFLLDFLFSEQ